MQTRKQGLLQQYLPETGFPRQKASLPVFKNQQMHRRFHQLANEHKVTENCPVQIGNQPFTTRQGGSKW